MRSVWAVPLMVVVLWCAGCATAERAETRDDIVRYTRHQFEKYPHLVAAIRRFGHDQLQQVAALDTELERFLWWRKHEWWRLDHDLARLIHEDWALISQLVDEVARFYHVEIEQWPKLEDDILRFMACGAEEWVNLTKDVAIFVEYHWAAREKLSDDLRQAMELVDWEIASVGIDLASFLRWREREYDKLCEQTAVWWQSNTDLVASFRQDTGRFVRHHLVDEPRRFKAQVMAFVDREIDHLPSLNDNLWRIWVAHTQNLKLQADARRSLTMAADESRRLKSALARYGRNQLDETRKLLATFDRWMEVYEYEYGPLKADVKRYFRYHLSQGSIAMDQIRRYFAMGEEEAYELGEDLKRFWRHSGVEWQALKQDLSEFFRGTHFAFGERTMPAYGDSYGAPLDEHVVLKPRFGNIDP